MYPFPILVPTSDVLKKYTGWFTDNNTAFRIVVTLDVDTLRLGCVSHIRGDILSSWTLSFSDVPAFNISGDTKEETVLNRPFQAHAMAYPGGHMVSFNTKKGAVRGVMIDRLLYARDKPGRCTIFKVPTEIRQMFWRYTLDNYVDNMSLIQRGDERIITGDMHTQFNRIHKVHPKFATESLHLELYDRTLECTDAGHLAELFEASGQRLRSRRMMASLVCGRKKRMFRC